MDFLGMSQAYSRYGASSFYSPVADLLVVRLTSDYGDAVNSLYFTGFLRSASEKSRPTLEGLFHQNQAAHFIAMPAAHRITAGRKQ
jgi:hypothetical protein